MKYEITIGEDVTTFTPFSMKLTFNTREEYVWFHDNVMPVIIAGHKGHEIMGSFYRAGRAATASEAGDVAIPTAPLDTTGKEA